MNKFSFSYCDHAWKLNYFHTKAHSPPTYCKCHNNSNLLQVRISHQLRNCQSWMSSNTVGRLWYTIQDSFFKLFIRCIWKSSLRFQSLKVLCGPIIIYELRKSNWCMSFEERIHSHVQNEIHLHSSIRSPQVLVKPSSIRHIDRHGFSEVSSRKWSGRFLGIIGWDPSVCKSNWLHVDILRFSFIKLGYIL